MSIAESLSRQIQTAIQWLESHHANALASYDWDTVLHTDEINSAARQLGYDPLFVASEDTDCRQLAVCSPTGETAATFTRYTGGEQWRNVAITDGQAEAAAVQTMRRWIAILNPVTSEVTR